MLSAYDYLSRIVAGETPFAQRHGAIRAFAEELQWTPSYEFTGRYGSALAEHHLAVEHGLENSAIISFVDFPHRAADISQQELRNLLAISYNNLVEWHVFVSEYDVRYVNNLAEEEIGTLVPVTRDTYERYLSAAYFEEVKSKSNVRKRRPSCDDALLAAISRWKRLMKADYPDQFDNQKLSALFNAIIFIRGYEDYRYREGDSQNVLLQSVALQSGQVNLAAAIEWSLNVLEVPYLSLELLDRDALNSIGTLDTSTVRDLFRDFYRSGGSPYEFNFALMSKHALSRIYERYVSILEYDVDQTSQLTLLPPVPKETGGRKTGAVYTPQFIAGFFARFVRENVTPRTFRALRTLDPACGSGIFLRTLLEYQCDPLTPGLTSDSIQAAFARVSGIDRDPNACEATRLSLALLHLVATGGLPASLNIRNADAVELALAGDLSNAEYDVVVANPPYIKFDHLTLEERGRLQAFLGPSVARPDAYLAFVKLCMSAVRPGGLTCLVLPHIFLQAESARNLRYQLSTEFDVLSLVDLSAVRVFEGLGTYNILLVAQRRTSQTAEGVLARVALVREFAGAALQACLDHKEITTSYYSVFAVDQELFSSGPWVLLQPKERELAARIESHPPLSQFLRVMQGLVTGDDETFIVPRALIPRGEGALFVPFLPDKEIRRFSTPKFSDQFVFVPFEGDRPLDASEIAQRYPKTWLYLEQRRDRLERRASVRKGTVAWWRPERPREPRNMLRPKIVGPHLMLTPRFGLDFEGRFAVSRSPFIFSEQNDRDLLKYAAAILNSSAVQWYMARHAHRYGNGYYRIERPFLLHVPFPDPSRLAPALLNEVLNLVDTRMVVNETATVDRALEELICSAYGLSRSESRPLIAGS